MLFLCLELFKAFPFYLEHNSNTLPWLTRPSRSVPVLLSVQSLALDLAPCASAAQVESQRPERLENFPKSGSQMSLSTAWNVLPLGSCMLKSFSSLWCQTKCPVLGEALSSVLVHLGCCNKVPQTDQLTHTVISHSSRGWKFKFRVPARSREGLLPGS